MDLVRAESEDEVVKILKRCGYWGDDGAWRDYGDNQNNFSTIGNQMGTADSALVEKLINSVDAVLLRECRLRKVDPTSNKAPNSIKTALTEYFDIPEGKLSSVDASVRTRLAENIALVATGSKSKPCYSIIDAGEGQSPNQMPNTFLSLQKSNKLKIPFVQGKFNMGSTGVLRFCSQEHNLQLIVSRRNPKLNNQSDEEWGFTVVRREDPSAGMRSSRYRYLAPNNQVLSFRADQLPLLPGEYPDAYKMPMESGSFIKLYEYDLRGYKSLVPFDLSYRLSMLLPTLALPIRLYERRTGYRANTYETTLSGLSVRLEDDRANNLENNFPDSAEMVIGGQETLVSLYAFKKGRRENYSRTDGIIFTINGQAHGFLPHSFFSRTNVGLQYLQSDILVIVDCTKFDSRAREDLFMNSRDRLSDVELKKQIERRLEEFLSGHAGLRALKEMRRQEEISAKLEDSKPLADVLEDVIKKSPALANLLLGGKRLHLAGNLVSVSAQNTTYRGKRFPTYFRPKIEFNKQSPKSAPINQKFRIKFETDADNDYLSRDIEPGEFKFRDLTNDTNPDRIMNLWNGAGNLSVSLPKGARVGDILHYSTMINDDTQVEPFINDFWVKVCAPTKTSGGNGGSLTDPPGESGKDRKKPQDLGLPQVQRLRKNDNQWKDHFSDDEGALDVIDAGNSQYDYFVNMDNPSLFNEIKVAKGKESSILEEQYVTSLVLIGLVLINDNKNHDSNSQDLSKTIYSVSRALAPAILPMLALGSLQE